MNNDELRYLISKNCFFTPQNYIERFAKYTSGTNADVFFCPHGINPTNPCHTHDFYEINYVYNGGCINIVNGRELTMKPHTAVILPPNTLHSLCADKDSEIYNILIRTEYFESFFSKSKSNKVFSSFLESQSYSAGFSYIFYENVDLNKIVSGMINERNASHPDKDIMMKTFAVELVIRLNIEQQKPILSQTKNTSDTVLNILHFIYSNYNTVTLDIIAKEFGYSRSQVSRLIISQIGVNFTQLLMSVKISNALMYLTNSNKTINEVSHICGFSSPERLRKAFKTLFNTTPSEFVRTSRSLMQNIRKTTD